LIFVFRDVFDQFIIPLKSKLSPNDTAVITLACVMLSKHSVGHKDDGDEGALKLSHQL
jgi:hypothetical protein